MSRTLALRAGDLKAAEAPGRLVIHGLGSCVAVFVYDPETRIGGLAHILLPAAPSQPSDKPGRYAPTAVATLLDETLRLGARRGGLFAKVTGGSKMFSFDNDTARPAIGERNVEAALAALEEARISVVATDVGGDCGRTVEADLTDGGLTIKTVRGIPRVI